MVDIYLFLGWDRVEMLYDTYLLLRRIETLSVGFEMLSGAVSLKWVPWTGIRGLICRSLDSEPLWSMSAPSLMKNAASLRYPHKPLQT